MAKPYSVSPVLRTGTTHYVATFRNARGERVTRGLGTSSRTKALGICAGLEDLWRARVRSQSEVAIDVPSESEDLYFGDKRNPDVIPAKDELADDLMAEVRKDLEAFGADRALAFPVLLDRARLKRENERQRSEISTLRRDLVNEQQGRQHLEQSVLGRAAKAGERVVDMSEALKLFDEHMRSQTTKVNAKDVVGVVKRFLSSLPADRRKPIDILSEDVQSWLEGQVALGDENKKASRRDQLRRRVGRFVNWAAGRWEYPSQMDRVPGVSRNALQRERGDIHWHTLEEVEAAIEAMPDPYWGAVVAMMGYAGLQLAELAWLRRSDVAIANGRGTIWVTTVEDPAEPSIKHLLKTGHRRRQIKIHQTYLLPRIHTHLNKCAGSTFAFPFLQGTQVLKRKYKAHHRKRREGGSPERWLPTSLRLILLGSHPGVKRTATPGLLPVGMTARSLRRTFGSLLLRSGKTTAEVAAAMGNTEEVVRQHYARILGCEVDIDF